jgi:hypothetical protein
MTSPSKKRVVRRKAFGILNAFGEPWTTQAFGSENEARGYMELFWKGISNPPDMSKHTIVPVTVTYTLPVHSKRK